MGRRQLPPLRYNWWVESRTTSGVCNYHPCSDSLLGSISWTPWRQVPPNSVRCVMGSCAPLVSSLTSKFENFRLNLTLMVAQHVMDTPPTNSGSSPIETTTIERVCDAYIQLAQRTTPDDLRYRDIMAEACKKICPCILTPDNNQQTENCRDEI